MESIGYSVIMCNDIIDVTKTISAKTIPRILTKKR